MELKLEVTGYHWHIDYEAVKPDFDGFLCCDFGLHHEDFEKGEYIPGYQLTKRFTTSKSDADEFARHGRSLRERLLGYPGYIRGYLECEIVFNDASVPEAPFNPASTAPYRISLKRLPPGTFREAEIHISIDRDASDPRLGHELRKMGLYCAELPKESEGKVAAVYTVQGTNEQILSLYQPLCRWLEGVGGAVDGSIKIELVPPSWGWLRCPEDFPVPPVIDQISWAK